MAAQVIEPPDRRVRQRPDLEPCKLANAGGLRDRRGCLAARAPAAHGVQRQGDEPAEHRLQCGVDRAGAFGSRQAPADDRAARGVLQFDRRHPPGKQCTHQGAFAGETVIEHAQRASGRLGGTGEIQRQVGPRGRIRLSIDVAAFLRACRKSASASAPAATAARSRMEDRPAVVHMRRKPARPPRSADARSRRARHARSADRRPS